MKNRLKEYREKASMTQEELAKKSGVCRTTISGLESGSVKVTSTKTLSKIAEALNKKVSDLFL